MVIRKERRRYVRLNILADVAYTKQGSGEKEKLTMTKNICAIGICLVTYEPSRESDVLDLRLCLPGEKDIINAAGKVIWVKEFSIIGIPDIKRYEVGVQFTVIDEKDMDRINDYVFTHLYKSWI